MYSLDGEMSASMPSSELALPADSGSHTTTASWRRALENVVPACVVLKYVPRLSRCPDQ